MLQSLPTGLTMYEVSLFEELAARGILPAFDKLVVSVLFGQLRTDLNTAEDESPDIFHMGIYFSKELKTYSPFVSVAVLNLQLL